MGVASSGYLRLTPTRIHGSCTSTPLWLTLSVATISQAALPSAASPNKNPHSCSTPIHFRNFLPYSKFFCAFPSRALRSLPLSVMMSGILGWGSGNLNNRGMYGNFWSSTSLPYTYSRYLNFSSTGVNSKNNTNKTYGFPLRRVARFPPKSPPLFRPNTFSEVAPAFKIVRFSFQSSPQPSSFGYDVGRSRLAQW